MRLIFAGTPPFAAQALRALLDAGHDIPLVLTQPDRPAGRGLRLQASAVKVMAQDAGLAVAQFPSLKDLSAQAQLKSVGADAMIVAAYGLLLPQAVLDIPRLGCLNIHASLLPRWRGAAPIQRALLAGDAETGISIMQMDAGLDSGPVLLQATLPISADDTAAMLHDKLAALGARSMVQALQLLEAGLAVPQAQDATHATYAAKLTKEEARVHWANPAEQIERAIRAFNPFPVAHTTFEGSAVKLWAAQRSPGKGAPGEILSRDKLGLVVACGLGALRVIELQRAGGKRLHAAQFTGSEFAPGSRFI